MFIAYTNDNRRFVENTGDKPFTWEDIPADVSISALALTHPVSTFVNKSRITPKISIRKYHYYYFLNEAVASVISSGGKLEIGDQKLQAKIIAGINVDRRFVLEVRVDKIGNTSINYFPLHALVNKIDKGLFNKEILRKGISCPQDKSLI
jgi:hypothetical protein